MKTKTLLVLISFSLLIIFFGVQSAHAAGDCVSVYGGGVVCPTPTPQLPSAGVEDFVLPGFVTMLSAGLFLATKASQMGKS